MENVKNALIFCLKRDVYLLNQTVTNFSQNALNSSKSFIKTYQYVSSYNTENLYVENLEIIINRLYQIIYMISCQYIIREDQQKNVVKPQVPSLGCLIANLVNYLHLQTVNVSTEKGTNSVLNLTKQVQTETKSLEKCDSCFTATNCIKKVMHYLDEHGDNTFVQKEMQLIHNQELLSLTQNGVMMKIASSIECDIEHLYETIDRTMEETQQYKNENRNLLEELQSKNEMYSVMEIEKQKLQVNFKRQKKKIHRLTQELQSYEVLNKEYRKQIWILNKLIGDMNENVSTLRQEKEEYTCAKRIQDLKVLKMIQEGRIIRDKVSVFNEKLEQYENDFWDCIKVMSYLSDNVICKLTNTIENIGKNCEELETRLVDSLEKNSLSNYIHDLFKKCQDVISATEISMIMNIQNVKQITKSDNYTSTCALQGDPLSDMTRKLAENKKQIEELEAQNRKLESITSKLSQLKSIQYNYSKKTDSTNT